MTIEHSKILTCFSHHFVTFFFWKVWSWSVRTGPENFGCPVQKDLNFLGPLVHYWLLSLGKVKETKKYQNWHFFKLFVSENQTNEVCSQGSNV